MALETYNDLKTYLQQLATDHTDINDFQSGNFDRLKHTFGGKSVQAPVMFVEWPSLNLADYDDNTEGKFQFGLFILYAVARDKFDDQDNAINNATEILRNIIARWIRVDKPESSYIIEVDQIIEPVTFLMIDNCFGAKVEVSIGDHIGLVHDETKWP